MFRSASLFIGTSSTVAVFTIFATSNVNSTVGIPHKIYSMQRILIHTRTTRTPAIWRYPPPPHDYPYLWVILDPKWKEDKVKVTIFRIFEFWNGHYTLHTFWSCLIRCANMKWIRWVLLKIQSGHDSVHRGTDGQGDTSIPPFQLRWSEGYNKKPISLLNVPICTQGMLAGMFPCGASWERTPVARTAALTRYRYATQPTRFVLNVALWNMWQVHFWITEFDLLAPCEVSKSRYLGLTFPIALKFDTHFGSTNCLSNSTAIRAW